METTESNILTALINALQNLVAANNCNYERDTMRREGYFQAAEEALALAGVRVAPRGWEVVG